MGYIEDVVSEFKELKSYERISMMCKLQHCCLPFELRFLGTCLEDLGKKDFYELRQAENEANNVADLNIQDLSKISNKYAQNKLILYLSLLHTYNYDCSNNLFTILSNMEEVYAAINIVNDDYEQNLERILMIYTLAVNHPAFSFEQKRLLRNILESVQLEENKNEDDALDTGVHHSNRNYNSAVSQENRLLPEFPNEHGGLSDSQSLQNASQYFTTVPSYTNDVNYQIQNQLIPTTNIIRYAIPVSTSTQIISNSWTTGIPLTYSTTTEPSITHSPIITQSTPSKSETSSRCTSPNITRVRPLSAPYIKTPSFNTVFYNSSSIVQPVSPTDHPILIKGGSFNLADFQNYISDQLPNVGNEETQDTEYSDEADTINKTEINGNNNIDGTTLVENNHRTEEIPVENARRFINGPIPITNVFYNTQIAPIAANANNVQVFCSAANPCQYCVAQQNSQMNGIISTTTDDMRSLQLDSNDDRSRESSRSSNSDQESSNNSPCDSPKMTSDRVTKQDKETHSVNWDQSDSVDRKHPSSEENTSEDKFAVPSVPLVNSNKERPLVNVKNHSKYSSGNHYSHRGRGNSHIRRRTDNSTNTEDTRRSFNSTAEIGFSLPSQNSASFPPANNATPPYIHPHFYRYTPPFGTTPGFIRPSYPFAASNGEILYHYPPPPGATIIPLHNPPIPYTNIQPPKLTCYNCGDQNHVAQDCPESTMEESSKQNTYRVNFKPPDFVENTN